MTEHMTRRPDERSAHDSVTRATLTVGSADDALERDADAVADLVVRSLANDPPLADQPSDAVGSGARVQRSATRAASTRPVVGARIQRKEYPHSDGEVQKQTLPSGVDSPTEFQKVVEELLDDTFIGIRALFMTGGVATSVEGWGKLLFGLLSEDYEMGACEPGDVAEVVENLKAAHRKEQFLQISEFYGYFDDSYQPPIWTLDAFTAELQKHHIMVDEDGKDDATLEALLDARGDRAILTEEPQRTFQFGSESQSLDVTGLKKLLDGELGTSVNWGHEITDCMDDSGKKGEMYYYQSGQTLKQVGNTTQSHASSKGGRTIIWERTGNSTEILAIGKHTTRADSKLSKGASYEIEKTFADSYSGYTGKIIGFKA